MKGITITLIALIIGFIPFKGMADPTIDVPNEIFLALKTGNAKELAKYFNTNIELEIFGDEEVYSKSQAELIMKDFFSKHTPSGFTKIHEGGKEGAKYIIGNLVTSTGTYRVYFLLKDSGGISCIHELRIEDE